MPQAARITINDGKGTPVAHNFDPIATEGGSATLANAASATLDGREKFGIVVRPATKAAPAKVSIRLTLPVETAQPDGTVLVTEFSTGVVELIMPASSTAARRKDLRVLLANALQHATLVDVIENVVPLY